MNLYNDDEEANSICFLASEGIARIEEVVVEGSELADFVSKMLDEAQAAYDRARISEAKKKWQSIVTLYHDSGELAPLVAEAQENLDRLDSK